MLIEPIVCSADVALTPKNTLRILKTIKPVTRVFTAMVAAKAVRVNVHSQVGDIISVDLSVAPTSQVAGGDR